MLVNAQMHLYIYPFIVLQKHKNTGTQIGLHKWSSLGNTVIP